MSAAWLHDVLGPIVEEGRVPGVIAVVAHGDETEALVLGRSSWDGPPLARDAQFRLASVTKPITGATVLALVDQGLLSLDEPVDRLLPELAGIGVLRSPDAPLDDVVSLDRPITVRDLLTFTAGVGQDWKMFAAAEPWPIFTAERSLDLHTFGPPRVAEQAPTDEWIRRLGTLPLLAQPGARWLYNTCGSVLGVLAARAAGTTFEAVMHRRVLEPLGMSSTAFHGEPARLVTAYEGDAVFDAGDGAWSRPPAFEDGSGGLVGTADDVVAFGRAMLRQSLLSPAFHQAMASPQVSPEQLAGGEAYLDGAGWGFCQAVHADGSFGWDGGFGTSYRAYPEHDLVVVCLTQVLWSSPEDSGLHDQVRAAAVATYG